MIVRTQHWQTQNIYCCVSPVSIGELGLSKHGFLFALMGSLLFLSMFLTGVAILVLTVPIYFPVALALGVDPIHLGILTALCIEIGSVIPPVGLNLFAVSGVTGLPVTTVIKGSFPFCISDTVVLIIVLLFPALALTQRYCGAGRPTL